MTRPAPPTDDVSGLLGALLDEAEELRNVRPELAYALAQRALTQVGEGARSHTAARALFLMGVAQYENKEPHSALRLLNTAAARAQTLGDDALACRALNATALVLTDLGDFGRAVQLHLTNLERTRARGDVPGQLRALVNLGGLHADAFERDLALRYAREAVALARETERPEYEVQAQHALGVVHTRSGQHRAALAVYERALLQVREHGLYAFEALVLGGLFGSLCALGRPGEVLARARQLQLKVSAELPVLAQFRLKLSLGRAHAECGDPAAAQPFLCAALELAQAFNLPREAADAHAALAAAHRAQGQLDEALRHLEEARTLDRAQLDAAGEQRAQLLKAQLAAERERARTRELQAVQVALRHQAVHDPLTGLANRAGLQARLGALLQAQQPFGLLFTDLDDFKRVNDTLGHDAGDTLLRQVAARLQALVGDDAARFGGDEFIVLFPTAGGAASTWERAQRVLHELGAPLWLDGRAMTLRVSGGLVSYPADGHDASTLLRRADTAMYVAKRTQRHLVRYLPAFEREVTERLDLDQALRRALARQEFRVAYQPVCDLKTGRPVGAEALVRWERPGVGLVSPAQFIGVAEDNGLIRPLGEWVLREACRQAQVWRTEGLGLLSVAVNVSPVQLADPAFTATVEAALADFDLPPHALSLEVTEQVAVTDLREAGQRLSALRALGVRISLDDFGTGQSSLAVLRHLPIDTLKLDQAFVRDVPGEPAAQAVITALLNLTAELGLHVVAEGVETQAHRQALLGLGGGAAQGYAFAPPLLPQAFQAWWHLQMG
ncbi:putative bifunctional diguanylate cyclase/phosphodiesterase [Deinococcus multiflagellatus]|uniref:putative bifunctional diguanylate cyclase/phosphodiesterase n=1 Tax=Deinococcus multiflagellatus TaxID=1656887 RepID=UPI001CCF0F89|nr:EAL domain-containing protein [Deinococcus multiflagellatus]MBZ9713112.1 EAL domain-containing protein [Deinococcus multiflagellatus]